MIYHRMAFQFALGGTMTNQIELDIHDRGLFANGAPYGEAGAYERLRGKAKFAVDPDAPAQANITDLKFAPRNEAGMVEFSADILILKPVDMSKSNRRIFYDYGNRANIRALQFFCDAPFSNDPSTAEHAGNGYLFRKGYTIVWCAWQGDVQPGGQRFRLDVPVATDNGMPITGPVRIEFIVEQDNIHTMPLCGFASTRSYPAASLDTSKASLTRRRYAGDAREEVPHDQWAFARIETGPGLDGQGMEEGLVPSDINVHMPGGFAPGYIYEIVYEGRDPLVLGLGYVAVRDFISFLRYQKMDRANQPNPLYEHNSPGIEKAYCWGRSQTGRLIRETIYQGFNADAENRKVFDGALAHVAGGGRMILNHRFACGTDAAGQELETHDKAADRFPFAYGECTDHLTGRTDAILRNPDTDPLVLHTQTATEYWQRRGSLVHTDTRGNDLAIPDTVRVYLWASTQHFADPAPTPPEAGIMCHPMNRAQTSPLFRAMLDAIDAWASDGTAPPDSNIPRKSDGTMLTGAEWKEKFPNIPGVYKSKGPAALSLFDYGSDIDAKGIISKQPPHLVHKDGYVVQVPAVDQDGNDTVGVKTPMVAAPLGTFTGWNIRGRNAAGTGDMYWFNGSYIPFADTERERAHTGDPRPSIQERYKTNDAYVEAVEAACRGLIEERLLLEEDLDRILVQARNWFRPWTLVRLS